MVCIFIAIRAPCRCCVCVIANLKLNYETNWRKTKIILLKICVYDVFLRDADRRLTHSV